MTRRSPSTLLCALVALTLTAGAAFAGEPPAKAAKEAATISVGQQAPWFAGWTLDQRLINRTKMLKDKEAKGHLVVFFATWCKPCKKKLTYLAQERAQLKSSNIRLTLVDYAETADLVTPFLGKFDGLSPDTVIVDQFGKMSRSFGVTEMDGGKEKAKLPLVVLLDNAGTVKAIYGEGEGGAEMLSQALATLK